MMVFYLLISKLETNVQSQTESGLILLNKMPWCAVELNKAADLDDSDGCNQGRNANCQNGVVFSLALGVKLKKN
jgi:hypothetical protein